MNIINDFFKGGGIYNKVSFAIGVLSLIFSVISYYSANKAKANASNAADMAKQVSGKLDILENQLAYTNKLKNSRACLLNRDEIEEAISNLNKLMMKGAIISGDESAIGIANGLVESFIESLGFIIVDEDVSEI